MPGKLPATLIRSAGRPELTERIDWPSFLGRQDLIWHAMPETYAEGAFHGNGLIGANIFADSNDERGVKRPTQLDYEGKGTPLRWRIGRTDVRDCMPSEPWRLPVGDMVLLTSGRIRGVNMRLDLWNAEAGVRIFTDRGEIAVRSFTHAEKMVIVNELSSTDGERDSRWVWCPDAALNTMKLWHGEEAEARHPEPVLSRRDGATVHAQRLSCGGEYAFTWKETDAPRNHRLLFMSVERSHPETGKATEAAAANVLEAEAAGLAPLLESHRCWWHSYYPRSFLSVPDIRLEKFYWIQMYTLASATRADRAPLDLMGPWFKGTPWPGIWWNLNIQESYRPVYAANRLDLGESFIRLLKANMDALAANACGFAQDSAAIPTATSFDCRGVAEQPQCNLLLACHNYWLHCRYSMDTNLLRQGLFPLLKRSVNHHFHHLAEGKDGFLHLVPTVSPEYQPEPIPDCAITLALLRWGCKTLVDICQTLGIEDSLLPTWHHVLEKLAPYPVDQNGIMVGANTPFAKAHRHFSHMLMFCPLYEEIHADEELAFKTLNHWLRLGEGSADFCAWPHAYASMLLSSYGRGNDALNHIGAALEGPSFNTFYDRELGPCFETPMMIAAALQEMLLQSWGGLIRVFPAVPDSWKDIAFHRLRAEKAFLVSAIRQGGKIALVKVESLAGGTCRVNPGWGERQVRVAEGAVSVQSLPGGIVSFETEPGSCVTLAPEGELGEFTVRGWRASV